MLTIIYLIIYFGVSASISFLLLTGRNIKISEIFGKICFISCWPIKILFFVFSIIVEFFSLKVSLINFITIGLLILIIDITATIYKFNKYGKL